MPPRVPRWRVETPHGEVTIEAPTPEAAAQIAQRDVDRIDAISGQLATLQARTAPPSTYPAPPPFLQPRQGVGIGMTGEQSRAAQQASGGPEFRAEWRAGQILPQVSHQAGPPQTLQRPDAQWQRNAMQAGQGVADFAQNLQQRATPWGGAASFVSDTAGAAGFLGDLLTRDTPENRAMTQNWRDRANGLAAALDPGREVWSNAPRAPAPEGAEEQGYYTAGNMAPNAVLPGTAVQRFAAWAVPTATTEIAGNIAERMNASPEAQQWARVGGGVVGGLGASRVGAPSAGASRVARGAENLNPGDVDLATALMREARDLPGGGVTVTPGEALAQVAPGRAAPLQALERDVSQTPAGSARVRTTLAGRPEQVRAATMGVADEIAPPIENPAAVGARGQETATAALTAIRRRINEQAAGNYAALRGQNVPRTDYARFATSPSYREALSDIRGNRELNASIAGLPDNDLAVINEVLKRLDRNAEAARVSPTNPQGDNTLAGVRDDVARDVRQAIEELTQRGAVTDDWSRARDTVATGRRDVLAPATEGPLGRMAETTSPQQQAGALYPIAPPEGQANATVAAISELLAAERGGGSPVAADLTRLRLVDALNEQTQGRAGGPATNPGGALGAYLFGNPAQADVFRAGVQAVAPDALPNVNTLAQALEATGTRLPTTPVAPAETFGGAVQTMRTLARPFGGGQTVAAGATRFGREQNANQVLDLLLADPETFGPLIRNTVDSYQGSRATTALLKALLAGNAAGTDPGEQR